MRYQIFRLQQSVLIELGLNVEEALFLDWLLNWKDGNSMKYMVIDGELAYWVNYGKVIEELPILFKPISDSMTEEEIKKVDRNNRTKVGRMLKGNLSKVFNQHSVKTQNGTDMYLSLNRDVIHRLLNENKKASTVPPVKAEDLKNDFDNKSIPQNKKKDTDKNEKNKESEIVEIINNSCVNIRKQDLKKCEEEFTDIDKLKEALGICEKNNSHGIKSLRMAYKYGNRSNDNMIKKQGTIFMADSKVIVDGKLKSVTDMTEEEFEQKLREKWGKTL